MIKRKLWLDDVRHPPDETWVWVKTSSEAIKELLAGIYSGGDYREISFDHDLGGNDDGYRVAAFIEEYAQNDYMSRLKWYIHSANPVGRMRIQAALMSADRLWERNEKKAPVG